MIIEDILKGLKTKKHKYIAQAISSIENNNKLTIITRKIFFIKLLI